MDERTICANQIQETILERSMNTEDWLSLPLPEALDPDGPVSSEEEAAISATNEAMTLRSAAF